MADKFCPRCNITKSTDEFSKNKARANRDGLASYCKVCVREYGKQKQYDKIRWENNADSERARHKLFMEKNSETQLNRYKENAKKYRKKNPGRVNATNRARGKHNFVPKWADKPAMAIVYEKAKLLSALWGVELQVDHVVPLRGKTVCGLHCWANLQLLAADLNHKKRHYEWPDMP